MPNVNHTLKGSQCGNCKGIYDESSLKCPHCSWWIDLVNTAHNTKEEFFDFLYKISNKSCHGFTEEIEKLEKSIHISPAQIIKNWNNVWHKLFYIINLIDITNASGTIMFFDPSGKVHYRLEYVDGKYNVR